VGRKPHPIGHDVPVKRSLRHPFGGHRSYLRPADTRPVRRKAPRQPRLRSRRAPVRAVLDVPDSSAARPALRLRVAGLVVGGLFAVLGLRLWALQVVQGPAATQAVVANQVRVVSIAPARGLILDRSGHPLVADTTVEQVTLSRVAAGQHPSVVGRLAALVGETSAQVRAALADPRYSPYKPVPVLARAPLATVLYVKEHAADFPGVSTEAVTERSYPQVEVPGPSSSAYPAAQTLGYVGTINAAELKAEQGHGYQQGDAYGQSGLEYRYEHVLRGTPGRQELSVDAAGQVVGTLKTVPATPGDDLVTNLDLGLQQVADDALAAQIQHLRHTFDPACNNNHGCLPAATNGAVVVLDPRSGAVYALSSYPSYDPSVWVGGISQAEYGRLSATGAQNNYAIDGLYTPGSTFKLATATAALGTGLWPPGRTYDDTGTYTVPNCQGTSCVLHNAGGEALGPIGITTAIAASDDAFFYNLGAQFALAQSTYGPTPIQDVAHQYGMGVLTGIDLPGEAQGRIDSQTERQRLHALDPTAFPTTTWFTGDNVEMAFGQGATVISPLEMAVAYATFANGGTRYAPEVVAGVVSPSGRVVERVAPRVTGRVDLPPSVRAPMLAGFEGAVNARNGTAYGMFAHSRFPTSELAGKTGTADTVPGKEPTGWFVGFGPVSDPEYVVACAIDQAGYGAGTCAPVVNAVFDYLATNPVGPAAVPPDPSVVASTAPVPPPPSPTQLTTGQALSPGQT
jgi:penicillin-binding protein 2